MIGYPRRPTRFGSSFAVDFLSLYFIQRYGVHAVGRWMEGLESIDFSWLKDLELDFYCRYNPNFVPAIPEAIRVEVLDGYHRCGILPYDETDWAAFHAVRSFLSQFHTIPA